MKTRRTLIILTISILIIAACAGNALPYVGVDSAQAAVVSPEVEYAPEDLEAIPADSEVSTLIQLNGTSITVDGPGAAANGSIVTISAAGTYQISGTLDDGQIIVDTTDAENVVLLLAGVDITSNSSAPIYAANTEKVILSLAAGSENTITDGNSYLALDESGEPNAAIFSKDDLTINGEGALTVNANFNNGIASKDDLKITGGIITVNAINDGLKGRDSVVIKDGVITINARGDGIQSTNTEETEKGYIAIEGGVFSIIAALDGMQAATNLNISGGEFYIHAGGGSTNTSHAGSGNSISMKGIKAETDVYISAGIFEIDAADDALHSNNSLTIDGGNFLLKSGDDGIHAEYALTINGGEVYVLQAFEGFESALITINAGVVHLVTADDGLNATTGAGGGQVDGSYFYINGGYIFLDTSGDGLDSNGTAIMNGGTVIVQGPVLNNNGPLDVNGEFEVNGGFLVVAGSSGMPETPSTNSAQNSIAVVLDSTQPGGTIIHIESLSGEEILTYESPKEFQLFVFSSPELQMNTTYAVYVGGQASGTITNGVYSDGSYTPGTLIANLEISSALTTQGNFQTMGPGGGPGGPGGAPGGGPGGGPGGRRPGG